MANLIHAALSFPALKRQDWGYLHLVANAISGEEVTFENFYPER